ncbi:MAG TPA: RHS repeat-associated core domain-containing protein, partial [bacterium]|nr:RHS repeat-associated core domain-containing protein [bacterium]
EGNRIAFERDGEGRRLCALRGAGSPEASKECVTRDEDGKITGFVDGDGYRTEFLRNRFGEVEEVVYPAGNRLRVERNDSGLVVGSRRMDSKGKLLSSARFEYGRSKVLRKASRLLWDEDPTKSRWIDSRPAAGIACESGEAGGEAPSAEVEPAVELNANGLVASITEGSGRKTRFFYDALDRLVLEVYPDGSERRTSYDKRDNVVRSVGRGGAVVEMDYDCAGRLIGRRLFSPNEGAEAREQRFEYDGLGRIVFAFDGNDPSDASDDAYSRFVYDSLSRPVAEESGGGWIVREYDDDGRVTVLGLPSGENFYMSYDESGLMQSLMLGSEVLASFEYDGSGALVREGLGENLSLEIKRDEGGRIIALSYVRTGGYLEGGQELMFGADGRVSMESGLYGLDRIYARDLEGRLISAKDGYFASDSMDPYMAGGSFRGWRYDYGADGSVERVGAQPGKGSSPRVVYDKAGNVESIGELGFSYDALGRLVGVSKGGSPLATYVYDAFDRRVAKRLAGEERRFVWDGFRLVREYGPEGSGSSFAYGATGNPPAVALYGRRRLYPMPDRLGSVTAVAGADGMAVARCGFGPYGEPVPAVPDGMPGMDGKSPDFGGCSSMPLPFGFAGHVRDDETGLVYMRYRYYSPSIMRFMTPDPLGYRVVARGAPLIKVFPTPAYHRGQGGASSATFPNRPLGISADYDVFPFGRADMAPRDIRVPGLMNLYSYAEGDPSTFVDPLGLASLLFDRSDETIALVMDNGIVWGSFSASNRATRPNADPLQVGGNGPFPNGTYSVGLPEFYSDRYREEVTINYELGILAPWETLLTGRHWKKDRKDSEGYSAPYGRIRIRAGSPSDGAMWSRGLFIHGGRHDYRKRTLGCIRVDDADLELLAVGMINLARDGDPVTQISVQD